MYQWRRRIWPCSRLTWKVWCARRCPNETIMASNPPEFWRLRFWGMPSLSGLYYTKNCDFSAIFSVRINLVQLLSQVFESKSILHKTVLWVGFQWIPPRFFWVTSHCIVPIIHGFFIDATFYDAWMLKIGDVGGCSTSLLCMVNKILHRQALVAQRGTCVGLGCPFWHLALTHTPGELMRIWDCI